MTIREQIARWLCPELGREADRAYHTRVNIADIRCWMLGKDLHDAVDVAVWLQEADAHYFFRKMDMPLHKFTLPANIVDFRKYLCKRRDTETAPMSKTIVDPPVMRPIFDDAEGRN